MIGIAMLRYVIKVEPLASADPEEIVAMVAPDAPAVPDRELSTGRHRAAP